jgi:hypothetical protein
MTTPATTEADTDPVRAAILTAIERLVDGTPQRSEGRLSVSQLAVEADVKRWHLTHQHTDVKDLFQARAQQSRTGLAAKARAASAYEELKIKHAELQRHCAALEDRLQLGWGERTAACSSGCRTGENARICAVEVGFEPTEELPPHTLSRRAPSATRRLHRR